MAALGASDSFDELQELVAEIYGAPNDRWFDLADMATNISRFTMRAIKAVRRDDAGKVEKNLAIAISWFASSANRLHMQVSQVTWRRFPYQCATCRLCPCGCGASSLLAEERIAKRPKPATISQLQERFAELYPPESRSLEHAAIHLIEEVGEYQEALLMYRTRHRHADLRQVETEAADFVSCALGLYSSIDHKSNSSNGAARALANLFDHNCHECRMSPCNCSFDRVMTYNLNDKW